jgi:hypothetical protein
MLAETEQDTSGGVWSVSRNFALDWLCALAYPMCGKMVVSLPSHRVSMSVPCALIVADNIRLPGGSAGRRSVTGAAGYEAGHSERQVTGSVAAAPECRWSATLAVPMTGDQSVLITIEREGSTPTGAPSVGEVGLVIPPGEVDAVLTLLRGIVAQARSEGVLPRRAGR